MCGIVGVMPRQNLSEQMARIFGLTQLLAHRGPDDTRASRNEAVCFGHARLSIIGVTAKEAIQPVKDGDNLLTFNGEIYNYLELNNKLEQQGIQVVGRSDTETLSLCLKHWGLEETLKLIDGMFAFAWYKGSSGELYLARDKVGEKPLYWASGKNGFWFASEIKAILGSGDIDASPNLDRVDEYFYSSKVSGRETMFKQVSELEPGSFIKLDRCTWQIDVKRYWRIEDCFWSETESSVPVDHRDFEGRLTKAIGSRRVSDVPAGVLLSGGIDSNTLTEFFLAERPSGTLDLFFADNDNSEISEKDDAEAFLDLARQRYPSSSLNFRTNTVNFRDFHESFRDLTWYYDEPVQFANSPLLKSLCKNARDHNIKVLFSGEGADELLFGYDRFVRTQKLLLNCTDPKEKIRQLFFGGGMHSRKDIFELTRDVSKGASDTSSWQWLENNLDQPLDQLQLIFSQKFRLQMLLQRQDRVGMSESVEIRVPFIAPDFVEYMNRLPLDKKFDAKSGTTKKILRDTMANRLPKRILAKPKDGFPTDMIIWLRQSRMKDLILEMVTDSSSFTSRYLKPAFVSKLVREHFSGDQPHDFLIWELFSLETWHSVYSSGVRTVRASNQIRIS
jgi:asparagine synthase (glutamine-hydrolysing)